MSDDGTALGTDAAIARARDHAECLARAQCTPGEIAASLWASHLVPDRVTAQRFVRDLGDDVVAWRLAGRADVRLHAYRLSTISDKPGASAVLASWGKQHLGWDKQGHDPGKQTQVEQREGAAASKLKAV